MFATPLDQVDLTYNWATANAILCQVPNNLENSSTAGSVRACMEFLYLGHNTVVFIRNPFFKDINIPILP